MFGRSDLHRLVARVATFTGVLAAAMAISTLTPGAALAATGLCINTAGATPIIFGPNSFYEPSDVQGPTSFKENAGQTVATYPLYRGTSGGKEVDYVITDASSMAAARVLGVNYAPKLTQAARTAAVESSSSFISSGNGINFPATVNFSATRVLDPNVSTGFPPTAFSPGPVGNAGYSPLVQVHFQGQLVILNAEQIANSTGQHPKLVSPITPASTTASLSETFGCFDDLSVHYVSFDSSSPLAASIENVTYAPNLNAAPSAGCGDESANPNPADTNPYYTNPDDPEPFNSPPCARESLASFTNGPTPLSNNQWQGLNNSLLTLFETGFEISPFNVLKAVPNPTQLLQYSPLWDLHLATWTAAAIAAGVPIRVGNFNDVTQEAALGYATGFPEGTPFGASGIVVTCPPVSLDVPAGDIPSGD